MTEKKSTTIVSQGYTKFVDEAKIKYETVCRMLSDLYIVLDYISKLEKTDSIAGISKESLKQYLRDSAIQRFEYTTDTLWKYLKLYLWMHKGVEQAHPKPVFKECFKAGLLSEEETVLAIKMVEDRNITSHAYKENIAKEISEKIPQYFELMKSLLNKVKP